MFAYTNVAMQEIESVQDDAVAVHTRTFGIMTLSITIKIC
jgi:hypothetical protein